MSAEEGGSGDEYYYDEEQDEAQQDEEQDWILDSITEYLKSPMWKNPILEFIDDNCVCFDTEDENKLEYTAIHTQFKELLECQLLDFFTTLGIDHDIFIAACSVAQSKVHKAIVGQILAVDNFLVFKKMMVARNEQLNQQALRQMEGFKPQASN